MLGSIIHKHLCFWKVNTQWVPVKLGQIRIILIYNVTSIHHSQMPHFSSSIVHFFWSHSCLYKQHKILPDSLFLCMSFYSSFCIHRPHPQYFHSDCFWWGETITKINLMFLECKAAVTCPTPIIRNSKVLKSIMFPSLVPNFIQIGR